MAGSTSGNNCAADGGESGSTSSSSRRERNSYETKFETLGASVSETIGESAPSLPNPYAEAWEEAFGYQNANWDELSEVSFAGAHNSSQDVIYMTKDEFDSYVDEFEEEKNIDALKGISKLLQEGRILIDSNSDDEEPKPKIRVRTRRR